jgi:hypothetical protein
LSQAAPARSDAACLKAQRLRTLLKKLNGIGFFRG